MDSTDCLSEYVKIVWQQRNAQLSLFAQTAVISLRWANGVYKQKSVKIVLRK